MTAKSSLLLLCGLAAGGVGLAAQTNPAVAESRFERIRLLNGALLSAAGQPTPQARAGIETPGTSPAHVMLAERASELLALMSEDPGRAIGVAFPEEITDRLRRAFPASAGLIEERGRWQGRMDTVIFDDLNGRHSASRSRIQLGGVWEDLHFAGPAPEGLGCEQVVEVEGLRLGGRVAVSAAGIVNAAGSQQCGPLGEQRIAVFPVSFPGIPVPGAPSPESLNEALFGAGPVSLSAYWRENSLGKATVSGQVFPWRTLDRVYGCEEYEELWAAVLRAVDPEVDFREFNRVFLVFPKPAGCLWAGLANVGCRKLVTADGEVVASLAWLVADYMTAHEEAVMLAVHEGGHNLGLSHASARDFGGEPLGPPGERGLLLEYGDSFSAMGYWNLGHYSARHKQQLGWWGEQEIQPVREPGSYLLAPASSQLAGVKALRIQRGLEEGNWLWLEARQPAGAFDRTLRSQVFSGALLHYEDAQSGARSELLDFTQSTEDFGDPALRAGQEWSDPYSTLKLSVNSATVSGLSVSVAAGPPPCVSRAPSLSVWPAHPAADAASPVSYTLTLVNNDSPGCGASVFGLSAQLPGGWSGAWTEGALSLAPGETSVAKLNVTTGTVPGTFVSDIRASRNGLTWSVPAYCTVSETQTEGEAGVRSFAAKREFQPPETIAFQIQARSGGAPVYPGTAAIILLRPDGTVYFRSVPLQPDGTAQWSYVSSPERDVPGEYAVKTILTAPVRAESWSSITVLPSR